ncbi:MAG: OmpH family outer membrane protein [Rudaea sp.]
MHSRHLLLTGLALAGAVGAQPAPAPAAGSGAAKIGYVDMLRLIESSPQIAEVRARLKREFAPRDEAIRADDAKLAALRLRYERDSAIMTKDDADALKREIDATERANKRLKDEARADFNERGKAYNNPTMQLIQDTVIEVARAQGYDLVVPSPVLYASSRIDLTDAVLQRLRQLGAGSAKP